MVIWVFEGVAKRREDVFDPGGYAVGGFRVFEKEGTMGGTVGEEQVEKVDVADGHSGEDVLEGVSGAVMGDKDPSGVVEEVVEIEEVHWVVL